MYLPFQLIVFLLECLIGAILVGMGGGAFSDLVVVVRGSVSVFASDNSWVSGRI